MREILQKKKFWVLLVAVLLFTFLYPAFVELPSVNKDTFRFYRISLGIWWGPERIEIDRPDSNQVMRSLDMMHFCVS